MNEILGAFILGLRFDLVALVLSNALFFLAFFLPRAWQKQKCFHILLVSLFVLINLFFISRNIVDVELYQLTGKRSNLELFRLMGDIGTQAPQLIFHYWYLTFFSLVLAYGLYRLYPRHFEIPNTHPLLRALEMLLVVLLLGVSARGGWQLKPLKATNAFIFSGEPLGTLALNSTFTVLRSKGSRLAPYPEVVEESQLDQVLPVQVTWPHSPTYENLVFIILESFSLEFVGYANQKRGYTPFLDELAERGLFFVNGFANGRRSIEAIPSLLSGIPSLLADPFITSDFSINKIEGLGHVLAAESYSTAFFHGAENGTMYFDSYTQRAGFKNYFGLNEYPNKSDSDGNWGIYDEPYLQYAIEEMNKLPKPFASVIFTLSSHQPYSVPDVYRDKFPKGSLEIHQSIGYTDYSLRQFFKAAEKQDWYSNTLFVLTADHTTKSDQLAYSDFLGRFRVPVIFYRPRGNFPKASLDQVVQHVDLPLSIMHLLGLRPKKWTRFGRSVFSDGPPYVVNRGETGYWYLNNESLVKMDGSGKLDFELLDKSRNLREGFSLLTSEQKHHPDQQIKLLIQYFTNSMLNNSLFVDVPEMSLKK
ncbi:MAG: LTA synthase family protein [Bdellovibrionales bacterium]|nr:LTA synthase family protein [Bdellovibrionales bacterium]